MPVAIGPQCLVGGSAADPYLQVTKRPLFDLEERCSPVLLDPCHGSVTSDGLDTIDGLAVGGEQIAAALVLIVKAGFELSILRFERGSIGAVEGAFRRIDGCQPEGIEDVACGRLRLLLKFGRSFPARLACAAFAVWTRSLIARATSKIAPDDEGRASSSAIAATSAAKAAW